jgi:hypothetical protein
MGFTRRVFLGMSGVACAMLHRPAAALAQQCVSGYYPSFLPTRLTVDCASKRNFRLFRQYPTYLGLSGVVSMTAARGKLGSYPAGNLFLFPWLKPAGAALRGKVWGACVPTSTTAYNTVNPIPNATLPLDEYFCNVVLQASADMFIGFAADVPFSSLEARLGLYGNVDRLPDGKPVGIDWASSNLNNPWFGGNRQIPSTATCNGAAWRKLIVDGLGQASIGAC